MKSKQRLFILRDVCIEIAYKISLDEGKATEDSLRRATLKDLIRQENDMIEFIENYRGVIGSSQVLSQAVGRLVVECLTAQSGC